MRSFIAILFTFLSSLRPQSVQGILFNLSKKHCCGSLQALQKIDSLSGGQKSRVAFAVLCGHGPNFLIMDEPTNHLDIQTIEALGNALCEYKVGKVESGL